MNTKKNKKDDINELLNRLVKRKESEEKNSKRDLTDTVKIFEKRESPKIPIKRN